MATPSRLIFVNLPVRDLPTSRRFFGALGFTFDPRFTTDECACMIVSEQAYVMLLQEARFAEFSPTPVADAHATTETLLCVSAESREGVDVFADTALANGGSPAKAPMDEGYMYGRSFTDPDGHVWEVMWMSPEAVAAGAAEMAQSA